MAAFSAEEYKKELAETSSIVELGKKLFQEPRKDQSYIFISYSHRDYKLVYQDLADLRESGVPFWFDEGLPAGENWDDEVRKQMAKPNCAGVIFYLSDNLFLSQSIQTEINIVCGKDDHPDAPDHQLPYFSVNLTSDAPRDILRRATASKEFVGVADESAATNEWFSTLSTAFPNKTTYLPFYHARHKDDLVKQINTKFNIYANYNPYEFSGAVFVCGHGTIAFDNGDRYEGDFCEGVFDGQGKMTYEDGIWYEGTWKAGKRHGQGTIKAPNGITYSGEWQEGMRHGIGTFKDSKKQHTGQWEQNLPNGLGIVIFTNGGTYSGQWKDGLPHGEGIEHLPNGDVYSGQFCDGHRQGDGAYRWQDGAKYHGAWENGERHGRGIMRYSNGDIYDGDWKNDNSEGRCTYIRNSDGHRYVGGWDENGPKGQGTYYYPDGASCSGIWDGDNLIEGRGVLRYSDGDIYDGEIRNNLRHGQGVYTLADGTVLSGTFRDDELVHE